MPPSLADIIFSTLWDIQSTRYAHLAASAIVVFDHLVTLDDEVELIWRSSWTRGKALFIINRYYMVIVVIIDLHVFFAPHITDAVSLRFVQWQGCSGLLACVIAQVILQMRLYALYHLNKRVLALMVVGFVLASATSATILIKALSGFVVIAHPLAGVTFCTPTEVPDWLWAFWVPILTFESLLCGLALGRGFYTFSGSGGSIFTSGRDLIGILVRDSAFYFLVVFATYLINMLIWIIAPKTLLEIPIGFATAMCCALTNRMILNVRAMNRGLGLYQQNQILFSESIDKNNG